MSSSLYGRHDLSSEVSSFQIRDKKSIEWETDSNMQTGDDSSLEVIEYSISGISNTLDSILDTLQSIADTLESMNERYCTQQRQMTCWRLVGQLEYDNNKLSKIYYSPQGY